MPADDTTSPFIDWLNGMSRAYGYARDADLARALGLPQSTVSRWRRQGARPSVEHLAKVSQVFGTDIAPLLALTGHIPADLQVDPLAAPPEPPSPMTETVRRIRDADIPEHLREILAEYWERRLREERSRIYNLIDEAADFTARSEDETKAWLSKLFQTDIPTHVADVFIELVKYTSEQAIRAQRRRRASAREEGTQAQDPREP